MAEFLTPMLEAGVKTFDAIGNDVAKPGVVELAYDATPLAALASLASAYAAIRASVFAVRLRSPSAVVPSSPVRV